MFIITSAIFSALARNAALLAHWSSSSLQMYFSLPVRGTVAFSVYRLLLMTCNQSYSSVGGTLS